MGIGPTARRLLGRHEKRVADWYRACFLDAPALAEAVAAVGPGPRLLEIGCGDGVMTEALVGRLPGATVLGIDIAEHPGRLYAGDPARASFRRCTVQELAAEGGPPFDTVLVVDVLHHVDDVLLTDLLAVAARLCRPGGHLMVKEWERNGSPGFWAGWFSDRVVSGQQVRFFDANELAARVIAAVPGAVCTDRRRVPPRRANLLVSWRLPAPATD
jgi:2-polyprenyl-6-hydroxyphenyl methylase/3-demethylubiquinone-9 3-methyltransferase